MIRTGLNPIFGLVGGASIALLLRVSGALTWIPFGVGERFKDAPAGVAAILLAVVALFSTVMMMLIARLRPIRTERRMTAAARAVLYETTTSKSGQLRTAGLRPVLDLVTLRFPNSLVAARLRMMRDCLSSPDRAERSANLLAGRSSLDTAASGHALMVERTLVWALPVLGFVGTAFAMARTVEGFSDALDAAENFAALKSELIATVVPHLAQAFDVTLVALTLTIVGFFCTALVERYQEATIAEADEVALLVLGKLPSAGASGRDGSLEEALERLTDTIDEANTHGPRTTVALLQLHEAVIALTEAQRRPRRITFIEERVPVDGSEPDEEGLRQTPFASSEPHEGGC